MTERKTLLYKLTSAGAVLFSLAAIVLVFLKNRAEIGPGLIAAGPCMALACVCHALQKWNSDRKRAVMMLFMGAVCAAVGIYFAYL